VSGISEVEAERLVILFGSLMYQGELAGRHVYTGPISKDGTRWHEVDQMRQVKEGMDYIRDQIDALKVRVIDTTGITVL